MRLGLLPAAVMIVGPAINLGIAVMLA
jgi:hypothetical protein